MTRFVGACFLACMFSYCPAFVAGATPYFKYFAYHAKYRSMRSF